MSKIEKRIQKWRNIKQPIPKDDVFSILNAYFPGSWSYGGKTGSHIFKVSHPLLKGDPDFGKDGDFTICTIGGQKIKPVYIKLLLKAIDIIKEK